MVTLRYIFKWKELGRWRWCLNLLHLGLFPFGTSTEKFEAMSKNGNCLVADPLCGGFCAKYRTCYLFRIWILCGYVWYRKICWNELELYMDWEWLSNCCESLLWSFPPLFILPLLFRDSSGRPFHRAVMSRLFVNGFRPSSAFYCIPLLG